MYQINSITCEAEDDGEEGDINSRILIVENYEPIHQAVQQFCRLLKEMYSGEKDPRIKAGLLSLVQQLLADQGLIAFII